MEPERIKIDEIEIVGKLREVGAKTAKEMPAAQRYRFWYDTELTLDDGRTLRWRVQGQSPVETAQRKDALVSNVKSGHAFALIRVGRLAGVGVRFDEV